MIRIISYLRLWVLLSLMLLGLCSCGIMQNSNNNKQVKNVAEFKNRRALPYNIFIEEGGLKRNTKDLTVKERKLRERIVNQLLVNRASLSGNAYGSDSADISDTNASNLETKDAEIVMQKANNNTPNNITPDNLENLQSSMQIEANNTAKGEYINLSQVP